MAAAQLTHQNSFISFNVRFMTPNSTNAGTQVLLSKYAMDPTPESVSRLGSLIAVRGAEMKDLAKMIAADRALTMQLLDGDVPANGATDEIERQIFRLGVEPILVLALSEPLRNAVSRTFTRMCRIELKPVEVEKGDPEDIEPFVSSLSITGRASGRVYLRLNEDLCRHIAAIVLGQDAATLSLGDLTDVLAELSNMIVGSFQSNLCDAGLSCNLSVPEVKTEVMFAPPKVPRGRHRLFGFEHQGMLLRVDLLVEFAG